MHRAVYQRIQNDLLLAVVCSCIGAAVLVVPLLSHGPAPLWTLFVAGTAWMVALALFVRIGRAVRKLGRGVAAARTAVLNLVAGREESVPLVAMNDAVPEVRALLDSLSRYQNELVRDRQAPDQRLVAVLGALPGGVVIITEQGQVSLLNGWARELLGAERARVGTSIFATLQRETVLRAVSRAQKADGAIESLLERLDAVALQASVTALAGGEGAVLYFPRTELTLHRPGVEFDLELHDVPPVRDALKPDLPLADLPAVVVDVETTGLT